MSSYMRASALSDLFKVILNTIALQRIWDRNGHKQAEYAVIYELPISML